MSDDTITPKEVALKVLSILQKAGFKAYFAGGCVRDRLLGREPKDFDIATNAEPDEVKALFRNTRKVGEAFGVMLVRIKSCHVEVATFRTDGDYLDGRRPEKVTFASPEEDAMRRDFTINGLFENPLNEDGSLRDLPEVIDFVGGQADLERKVIRAIGTPEDRFKEDYLRLLRAVRFTARYQFELEIKTRQAILKNNEKIALIARERIGQELRLMLTHTDPMARLYAINWLQRLDLIESVLPDCVQKGFFREKEHFVTSGLGVTHPTEITFGLSLAGWLLDDLSLLNPTFSTDSSIWKQLKSLASSLQDCLCLSNEESNVFLNVLLLFRKTIHWQQQDVAWKKRLLANTYWQDHWSLFKAWAIAQTENHLINKVELLTLVECIHTEQKRLIEEGIAPEPLVNGNDLIQLGYRPGPNFKDVLEKCYDAQLRTEISSKDEAEQWVKSFLAGK